MAKRKQASVKRDGLPKRAMIYARVSTDEQAEHGYSLKGQVEAARKYAGEHGLEVVAVYEDGGISGALPMDARPRGREMLDALRDKAAEVVIAYTADRLSRNAAHFLVLRDQWQKRGIELHYVDRGQLQNSPEGRLMQTIESGVAEYERKKIRMRTMGGKRSKVKSGKWLGIHTPYGYTRQGKGREAQLAIGEGEAAIIRQVFEWYVRGDGSGEPLAVTEICQRLEARGILPPETKKGRSDNPRWNRASLRTMLQNEIYAGYVYYGKVRLAPKDFDTQSLWEREVAVPPEEWVRVDLPELAIISPVMFASAHVRAKRNKDMANRARHDYVLSGFLKCGHCGWAMGGAKHTKHKKGGEVYTQFFYRCPNPDCEAKTKIQVAHALDSKIWDWLMANTENDTKLREGIAKMGTARETELVHKRERLATCEGLLVALAKKIRRIVADLYGAETDVTAEALRGQRAAAEKEYIGLSKERDMLLAEVARRELTQERQEQIYQMARAIGRRMGGYKTAEQKRAGLEALEVSVKFWRLDSKRRIDFDWALGAGAVLYLGDDNPCLPNTDWGPCTLPRRAR